MADPNHNLPAAALWEVRSGRKTYRISEHKIILRLWQEGKLTASHRIRRQGTTEWVSPDEINWSAVESLQQNAETIVQRSRSQRNQSIQETLTSPSMATEPLLNPLSDQLINPLNDRADEVETRRFPTMPDASQITVKQLRTDASNQRTLDYTAEQQVEAAGGRRTSDILPGEVAEARPRLGWWRVENTAAPSQSTTLVRIVGRITWAILAICVIGITILFVSSYSLNTAELTTSSSLTAPVTSKNDVDAALSSEPTTTDSATAAITPAATPSVTPAAPLVEPTENLAPTQAEASNAAVKGAAVKGAAAKGAAADESPKNEVPANDTKIATAVAGTASNSNTIVAASSNSVSPALSASSPTNIGNSATTLAPALSDDEARTIRSIEEVFSQFQGTDKEIRELRTKLASSQKAAQQAQQLQQSLLVERDSLFLKLKNTRLQVLEVQEQIALLANMKANTQTGIKAALTISYEQKIAELTELRRAESQLQVLLEKSIREAANAESNVVLELRQIQQSGSQLQQIARKEATSLETSLELLDFFGEKSLEFHQKVFDLSAPQQARAPDMLFANILNSASAIHLSRWSAPIDNYRHLKLQLSGMSEEERQLRRQSLVRFDALAATLAGMTLIRREQQEEGLKSLDYACKVEPNLVEIQLVYGSLAMKASRVNEGKQHFLKAIQLHPESGRVYRIALDSLLSTNAPTPQLLKSWRNSLEKRTDLYDQRAWLTIAAASIAMGDKEHAVKSLEKVADSALDNQKQRLVQKIQQTPDRSDPAATQSDAAKQNE